jgi:hypothetical protein
MLIGMHVPDYVECPNVYVPQAGRRSLFLGGGITNCPDWRAELRPMLAGTPWVLINPRRTDIDMNDTAVAMAQIDWEHRHLHVADAILFWFCQETLQPITLYELGAWSMTTKPLFVGAHPAYPRRIDILVQTHLSRPDVQVVDSLEALAAQVRSGA